MKTCIRVLLASLSLIMCGISAKGEDSYPDLYLRGEFSSTQWAVQDSYRFSRNGDVYTLHIKTLDGRFKISNHDWSINFGAESEGDTEINRSTTVAGIQNGLNYHASGLTDVEISFTYSAGSERTAISIKTSSQPVTPGISGTLPVLYIDVRNEDGTYNNEVISKDLAHKNYFQGTYYLDLNGCEWLAAEGAESIGSAEAPLPLEIKARGNYTRKAFAKKPFKLKLGAKQKMLGMSKSKHYALLAHADDNKGYLRNFTGFNLGHRIGLPWTPSQQPVEVVINGDYRGLYFLTESIRVGDGRVPVESLDDNATDPALISGGYLVELDNYDEDNQIRMEEKGCYPGYKDMLRITFDTPEEYSDIQRRFVEDQFTAMNNAVGENSDELWAYLDLDDAARYYIVEEIISHTEAYHGSTYLFRDRGEGQKWHFSPLWDCGNAFNGPSDGFFYFHSPFGNTWIPSMRMNERFNDKVHETWRWFMSEKYDGIIADIDAYVAHISEAALADRRRWKDSPVPEGGQPVTDNSDMKSRRDNVVAHLDAKTAWLVRAFGDYSTPTPEPARDTTPAAPLPEYAQSGVEDVTIDSTPADARPEYFNLQGIRVKTPASGQIYIERRGTAVRKIEL